ncbi:MAG: acetolactate decarboxylase [Actinomycetota bacterium]
MSENEIRIPGLRIVEVPRARVQPDRPGERHILQVATLDGLMAGRYDGDVTIGELLAHGDHGIGTLNSLNGELLVLDGEVFQMTADGVSHPVPPERLTPFAMVAFMRPDADEIFEGTHDRSEIEAEVGRLADSPEASLCIRLDGHFPRIDARSAVPERKPYRLFAEALAANQRKFKFEQATGSFFGYRFPDEARGIEIPGYHLHFVTEDRARGGHMLDFQATDVRIRVMRATVLQVELPPGAEAERPGMSEKDLGAVQELEG